MLLLPVINISLLLTNNLEHVEEKSDPLTTGGLFVPDQISKFNSLSQKEVRLVTQC